MLKFFLLVYVITKISSGPDPTQYASFAELISTMPECVETRETLRKQPGVTILVDCQEKQAVMKKDDES